MNSTLQLIIILALLIITCMAISVCTVKYVNYKGMQKFSAKEACTIMISFALVMTIIFVSYSNFMKQQVDYFSNSPLQTVTALQNCNTASEVNSTWNKAKSIISSK